VRGVLRFAREGRNDPGERRACTVEGRSVSLCVNWSYESGWVYDRGTVLSCVTCYS
jgi:hypothetical protein